jgi:hypothetical protein
MFSRSILSLVVCGGSRRVGRPNAQEEPLFFGGEKDPQTWPSSTQPIAIGCR